MRARLERGHRRPAKVTLAMRGLSLTVASLSFFLLGAYGLVQTLPLVRGGALLWLTLLTPVLYALNIPTGIWLWKAERKGGALGIGICVAWMVMAFPEMIRLSEANQGAATMGVTLVLLMWIFVLSSIAVGWRNLRRSMPSG